MISIINYYLMKKRINKITLPNFENDDIIRKRLTFYGKVKRVSFRNEVLLISRYLGIVGFVYNGKDHVIAELEGTLEQINYIIDHLKSVPRFTIRGINYLDVDVVNEKTFYKK